MTINLPQYGDWKLHFKKNLMHNSPLVVWCTLDISTCSDLLISKSMWSADSSFPGGFDITSVPKENRLYCTSLQFKTKDSIFVKELLRRCDEENQTQQIVTFDKFSPIELIISSEFYNNSFRINSIQEATINQNICNYTSHNDYKIDAKLNLVEKLTYTEYMENK